MWDFNVLWYTPAKCFAITVLRESDIILLQNEFYFSAIFQVTINGNMKNYYSYVSLYDFKMGYKNK